MFYVEWLRVRNCLRILAIVFGVVFLLGVIARLAVGVENGRIYAQIQQDMNAQGAQVSRVAQSDGSTRTTIYDPADGDHIVIVDRGWQGKNITLSGPNVETDRNTHVQVGTLSVHSTRVAGQQGGTVQIDTDVPVPVRILFPFAVFVALVIGTVLAGPLSKENSNYLEVVWTKPASRESTAIGYFLIDALAILISMAMTIILFVAVTALFEVPRFVADATTLDTLALSFFMPLAWYALLTAASASLKRGRGAVLGLGWVIAWVLPGFAIALTYAAVPLFHYIGVALSYVSLLDPMVYMHLSSDSSPGNVSPAFGDMLGPLNSPALVRAAMLLALTLIYSVLSLVQWRRLEA